MLLFGVAGYVLIEAARRLSDPPEIDAAVVLVVGVLGLAVNLASFFLLRAGAKESLNVRGAYLEVVADALGSFGVIVAAVVDRAHRLGVGRPGHRRRHRRLHPAAGVAPGRARRCGSSSRRRRRAPISVPSTPISRAIPGVVDVHDLHVWTLTSEMEVATAHVMVATGTDSHAVLDQARSLLNDRHGLAHATLQVEPDDHRGCDEVSW